MEEIEKIALKFCKFLREYIYIITNNGDIFLYPKIKSNLISVLALNIMSELIRENGKYYAYEITDKMIAKKHIIGFYIYKIEK
jgi:hypothetical protein